MFAIDYFLQMIKNTFCNVINCTLMYSLLCSPKSVRLSKTLRLLEQLRSQIKQLQHFELKDKCEQM